MEGINAMSGIFDYFYQEETSIQTKDFALKELLDYLVQNHEKQFLEIEKEPILKHIPDIQRIYSVWEEEKDVKNIRKFFTTFLNTKKQLFTWMYQSFVIATLQEVHPEIGNNNILSFYISSYGIPDEIKPNTMSLCQEIQRTTKHLKQNPITINNFHKREQEFYKITLTDEKFEIKKKKLYDYVEAFIRLHDCYSNLIFDIMEQLHKQEPEEILSKIIKGLNEIAILEDNIYVDDVLFGLRE